MRDSKLNPRQSFSTRIGQPAGIVLSAVLGSAITLGVFNYWGSPNVITLERSSAATAAEVVQASFGSSQGIAVDFTATAEKTTPAVVHIRSTYGKPLASNRGPQQQAPDFFNDGPFRDFFDFKQMPQQPQGPSQSSGSGVIISKEGYIVTNNHVIENATEIEVIFSDKRSVKAKLVGTDPSTDIAVLQVKDQGILPTLAFANSDAVRVGEWVVAVGNPFNLESTVTAGVVSAKSRNINILRGKDSLAIESFIQTDAAVNPGNSGGALVNVNGDLVGINTAIASPTGSYSGYSFAVPSNIVNKVVEDLIKTGVVQRGLLGVQIVEVNGALVKEKELDVTAGVYVGKVNKGSAAEAAGVKEGDVILKIDQMPTTSNSALQEAVVRHRPGDKVVLTINRKGKEQLIDVVLRNRAGSTEIVKLESPKAAPLATAGLDLAEATDKDLKAASVSSGVRVKDIKEGLVSRQTDMKPGFIITKVDKRIVKTVKEVQDALKKSEGGVMIEGVYPDYPGTYYYAFGLD